MGSILEIMQSTVWEDISSWVIGDNLPVTQSVSAEWFTGPRISSLHALLSKDSGGPGAQ